jgi:hypothetical protein
VDERTVMLLAVACFIAGVVVTVLVIVAVQ